MEKAPRPQFEGDNKEVSKALEAGLKRRGIEPLAERTPLPQQEKKGDLRSHYDIAAERASEIKTPEEAEKNKAFEIEMDAAAKKFERPPLNKKEWQKLEKIAEEKQKQ